MIAAADLLAGIALIITGGADRLWHAIEPAIPWRTGPTAQATLPYLALLAAGWLIFNRILELWIEASGSTTGLERLILRAAGFIVAGSFIIAAQVLIRPVWVIIVAAGLLIAVLLDPKASRAASLLAWAWITIGLAISGLLINPWFLAQPTFIPRLAMLLTAWRILGMIPPLRIDAAHPWTPDWLP